MRRQLANMTRGRKSATRQRRSAPSIPVRSTEPAKCFPSRTTEIPGPARHRRALPRRGRRRRSGRRRARPDIWRTAAGYTRSDWWRPVHVHDYIDRASERPSATQRSTSGVAAQGRRRARRAPSEAGTCQQRARKRPRRRHRLTSPTYAHTVTPGDPRTSVRGARTGRRQATPPLAARPSHRPCALRKRIRRRTSATRPAPR